MGNSKDLNKKVDKEEGKKLTSNDFTNQYKAKLDSVQENAQINVIEEIRVNNVPLTITGKAVNISLNLSNYVTQSELTSELSGKEDVANKINSLTSAATHIQYASAKATFDFVNEKLSNVYKYQGSRTIAQLNALVVDASMNGFVYNVTNDGTLTNGNVAVNAGDNVSIVWNEQTQTFSWDKLASTFTVDLSNYYTKPETNTLLNTKVDKVTGMGLSHNDFTDAYKTKLDNDYTAAEIDALLDEKQDTLTFDNTPTENSNNPVKSGGVYAVISDLEERVTALEESGGGSGTSEQMPIDINILEMKIIQDSSSFNENAPGNRCYYDYIQDGDARNDPRFAYLHIKSSFIDSYAEEQIEAGNFIIRFDYSTKYKKTSRKLKGDGRYSFAHNFYDQETHEMLIKMPILENSFIYIDTNDIKTDAQGRKFIYKKIPITRIVNALWYAELTEEVEGGGENVITPQSFSNEYFEYEQGELDGVRVGGAVQTHFDTYGSEGVSRLRDSGSNKYFATSFTLNGNTLNKDKNPFKSPNKDIPFLHYWCPFLLPAETHILTKFARSFYSRRGWDAFETHRKFHDEAVTKPRFAVLDPNYATITQGSIWIKKYPQYNKRLYCYPGQMFPELFSIDGEDQDVRIVRFGI